MCDGTPGRGKVAGGVDVLEHRRRHQPVRGSVNAVARSPLGQAAMTAGWWGRLRATARCGRRLGHCLHLHADASPMDPDWFCCECPKERGGGIPAAECVICCGPGVGVEATPARGVGWGAGQTQMRLRTRTTPWCLAAPPGGSACQPRADGAGPEEETGRGARGEADRAAPLRPGCARRTTTRPLASPAATGH